ncbi:hypothetical protein [Aquimarina algicola]|uniref:Bacteriocin n=1 Tax=Aquimarina algicola TaxID=2589995 RepID=A0A504IV51_9FLAO|nr:hypothetical protein [Aquimarina algicola]TPN82377.1 hypothetical protein FHK87_23440 [Aquimarina algicola]
MKKILELKGVHKLQKEEQKGIKGSNFNRPYCGPPGRCCVRLPEGGEFCDFGYCVANGCIWA